LAFVGLALVGYVQESKREFSLAKLYVNAVPLSSQDVGHILDGLNSLCTPSNYQKAISRFSGVELFLVGLSDDKMSDSTCEFWKASSQIIKEGRFDLLRNLFNEPVSPFDVIFFFPRQTLFLFESRGDFMFISFTKFMLQSLYYESIVKESANNPELGQDFTKLAFQFVIDNIWPFVFALALALRLTRVTADVTEWPV
jgi:hypothetical protein